MDKKKKVWWETRDGALYYSWFSILRNSSLQQFENEIKEKKQKPALTLAAALFCHNQRPNNSFLF